MTVQDGALVHAVAKVAVHPVAVVPTVMVKELSLPTIDGDPPHEVRVGAVPWV